jgi:uracil-DNA glycosylase
MGVVPAELVRRLAAARIGQTFNQYRHSAVRRERLCEYLARRKEAPILLVGEAAGYRGARVSGLPFTSQRQLTGSGQAEATATIVHRVLVPTHPHLPGEPDSNRRPTRSEIEASLPFLVELAIGRRPVAVGRLAAAALDAPYVRHPSHGGAREFCSGLVELLVRG